jgi:hypothetical protein
MRLIGLVVVLPGGLVLSPLAGEAQQARQAVRIGVLTAQSRETSTASWESFRQGLRDLGWEEGRNLVTEARFAAGIVMVEVGDPVATGFVTNLARPGGNVTGVSLMLLDLTQKRLALLKEAVPRATRIAVIMNPDDPIIPMQCRAAEVAAGRLGVRLQRLDIRNADDLRRAFEAAVKDKAGARRREQHAEHGDSDHDGREGLR